MPPEEKKGFVPLALCLRTDESVLGRLKNIRFITSCSLATVFKYYWHGPEEKAWCLRFHILKNILRQYLADSLPHDLSNEMSQQIDFSYIADYIERNNLPARPMTPEIGWNDEFNIVVDAGLCLEYKLNGYDLSASKLNQLAKDDLLSAQQAKPRTISCQVVVGAQSACYSKHTSGAKPLSLPESLEPQPLEADEQIIIHFHGGAYCVGDRSLTHLYVYGRISSCAGLRVFSPNYRLAPRHCYPSQLHDCFLAYTHLLGRGFKPENIILAGDSAGGALALGLLFILREMKMPQPSGLVLISPWVDSLCSGESWTSTNGFDYLPSLRLDDPFHPTRMFYAAGTPFSESMREELKCPLVSPLFGDLSGLPPILIQMGEHELLGDDIRAFHERVLQQNSMRPDAVKLEVYKAMPHVFMMFDFTASAQQAFASIGEFTRTIFSKVDSK